jgi:FkbM family methyltransferase
MSLMTNPVVFRLRRYARMLGVPKFLARFTSGYEASYATRLAGSVRTGDVVWDVGANIGYYTTQLATLVGQKGKVFAFEPDEINFMQLHKNCENRQNIYLQNYGLSDHTHHAKLLAGSDNLRATSRIVSANELSEGTTNAQLHSGDEIITTSKIAVPNIVKIDVEGHELSVLEGMRATLRNPLLRGIFVEIHFGILDRTGRSTDASMIEKMLKHNGYQIEWVDPSHVYAAKAK